ncbi:MAG: hypothetical protein QXL15_03595 [Candidatus Korarchaeota archaeon]
MEFNHLFVGKMDFEKYNRIREILQDDFTMVSVLRYKEVEEVGMRFEEVFIDYLPMNIGSWV